MLLKVFSRQNVRRNVCNRTKENYRSIWSGCSWIQICYFNDFNSFKSLTSYNTAAVIIEIIQGESGVLPADPLFVKQLNEYCIQKDILIIVDEVQTGIGRTGKLYAHEHYQLSPDIITLAKGLGNGLPIGAMLGKRI